MKMIAALQHRFVGGELSGGSFHQLLRGKADLKFVRNGIRDFILDDEDVNQIAIITFGPKLRAVAA